MSRRIALLLACLSVLVALAVAPWTISSPRLKDQIARQLRSAYGLELIASGPTTLALLPVPRLKLTGVSLASADGSVLVEGAQFRGEVQLLPLIAARLDLTDISILRGTMQVQIRPDGSTSWDSILARTKESLTASAGGMRLRRFIVQHTRIVIDDQRRHGTTDLADANLVARWPSRSGSLEVAVTAIWKGEPLTASLSGVVPAELASHGHSRADIHVSSRRGSASFSGLMSIDEPRLEGEISATTTSLNGLMHWSGFAQPSPAMAGPLQVAGAFALTAAELSLPRVTVTAGSDRFEGAVSVRLDQDRRGIRATMAGDSLDLTPALGVTGRDPDAVASDLMALRQADIDLRLSASTVTLGSMQLHDAAMNLLTSADRVEISLGRAGLSGGVVKGRLALTCLGDGYGAKLQSSFSKVDLAGLQAELGHSRMLTGTAQGQAALEADGATLPEIVRSLSGRIELSLQDGEILGLPLGEASRGAETRPQASARRPGARTSFQQIALDLNVADGLAEVASGSLDGPALHASLKGEISFVDRLLRLTAEPAHPTDGTPGGPGSVLEISGPWASPAVRPAVARAPQP